jgi:putative ABC transport system permease protein
MRLKSVFTEAAQALRFNRQRSILTVISLAWGVACFVILYPYGEGFDITLRTAFQAVGQDLIVRMMNGGTSTQAGGERAGRRIRMGQMWTRS